MLAQLYTPHEQKLSLELARMCASPAQSPALKSKTQAKRRNPAIKLYGLPWGFPGFLNPNASKTHAANPNGAFTDLNATANYTVQWLLGAKREHGLDIDYVGLWNERNPPPAYAAVLRDAVDAAGLGGKTTVVGPWSVCAHSINSSACFVAARIGTRTLYLSNYSEAPVDTRHLHCAPCLPQACRALRGDRRCRRSPELHAVPVMGSKQRECFSLDGRRRQRERWKIGPVSCALRQYDAYK